MQDENLFSSFTFCAIPSKIISLDFILPILLIPVNSGLGFYIFSLDIRVLHRSISGITRSRLPRNARASASRVLRAHSRNRLKLEKQGERTLSR